MFKLQNKSCLLEKLQIYPPNYKENNSISPIISQLMVEQQISNKNNLKTLNYPSKILFAFKRKSHKNSDCFIYIYIYRERERDAKGEDKRTFSFFYASYSFKDFFRNSSLVFLILFNSKFSERKAPSYKKFTS